MVVLLVILTVAAILTVEFVMYRRRMREKAKAEAPVRWDNLEAAMPPLYRSPAGLFYHSGHTWAYLDPSGEASVGIDDFAQGIIGHIERIELPAPGTKVRQGERAFTLVQKNKSIDFVSPLDGYVNAVNAFVNRDTSLLKKHPYTEGWLLTIQPNNLVRNLRKLKIGSEALDWLEKETKRFVEFLTLHSARPQEVGITMHDGGLYLEGIVEKIDGELLQLLMRKFFR